MTLPSEILTIPAEIADVGKRLDRFLAEHTDLTRSHIQKLLLSEKIQVCGKTEEKNYKIRIHDIVELTIDEPCEWNVEAESIPLDIVYEDKDLLVVNKPQGMVVHPAAGNPCGTLVNALLAHCRDSLSGINGVLRPGIVHRIDKDTSGLLIVAKNDQAHLGLAEQIKEHSFDRIYHTVVYGSIKNEKGTIDLPINRNTVNRLKMAVSADGKRAITHYEVLERFPGYTYLQLRLETGRTHQIRVHLSHLGHPVLGDPLYASLKHPPHPNLEKLTAGQCLHAKRIGFVHPITKEKLFFESELPEYFQKILAKLRNLH